MDYFVVYDLNDNLIAYLDNVYELIYFTGLRLYDINYKFKNTDHIVARISRKSFKIYKFC